MFDLYGLPADFPGYVSSAQMTDPYARVRYLESQLEAAVGDHRLIAYLQLHEFEALLLSDPSKFDWQYIEHADRIKRLIELSDSYPSPEEINDGTETAPSKRIVTQIPEYRYQKAAAGPEIARQIGISTMRERCPHFAEWLAKLEALGQG